jgi:hypothetical protein
MASTTEAVSGFFGDLSPIFILVISIAAVGAIAEILLNAWRHH